MCQPKKNNGKAVTLKPSINYKRDVPPIPPTPMEHFIIGVLAGVLLAVAVLIRTGEHAEKVHPIRLRKSH